MRTVRNTVNTGRTVVCTIHQPSIDIFEAFDDLLLMKSGGYVTYHGHLGKRSCKLVEYFEVRLCSHVLTVCSPCVSSFNIALVRRKQKSTPVGMVYGKPWVDQWRHGL